MRSVRFTAAAAAALMSVAAVSSNDYVYSDAFERRACDGDGCNYCSPADPQPLCGTHSHCLPQEDASSLCTYPDGNGAQGALCSANEECAGPNLCAPTATVSKCLHWCRRPAGTECQTVPGTSCIGFVVPALIGTQEWGVCM